MTHSELTAALETLQKAGTISAGWVARGEIAELANGESVTEQQLSDALASWQTTTAQRKIWSSAQEFWDEFTMAEQIAISKSTEDYVVYFRSKMLAWRGRIISDDPERPEGEANRVTGGLDVLVGYGLLTPERKTKILSK